MNIAVVALPLRDLWDRYCLHHELTPDSERSYLDAVKSFERWRGSPASADQLAAQFNEFVRGACERLSRHTVHGHRSKLRAMLAWADVQGWAELPKNIRLVKRPKLIPRGFTDDEWDRLRENCQRVKDGRLLRVGIEIDYDIGVRRGDLLLRVCWRGLAPDGRIAVAMNKANRIHVGQLEAATIEMAKSIRVDSDDRMVPWPWGLDVWNRRFRKLRDLAGVSDGATQKIRRTGASHVKRAGGDAAHYLGHSEKSGASVAQQFYLDPLIVGDVAPLPPRIGGRDVPLPPAVG